MISTEELSDFVRWFDGLEREDYPHIYTRLKTLSRVELAMSMHGTAEAVREALDADY